MKPKLIFNFIISIILIISVVAIINVISLMGFIHLDNKYDFGFLSFNTNEYRYLDPIEYVRDFSKSIQYTDGNFSLTKEGESSLDFNNAWIQILDENGSEVYNYKKTETNPDKYTPFEIVDYYKYSKPSTVFIGKIDIEEKEYSYLIGFPINLVKKNVLIYNPKQLKSVSWQILLLMLFVDIIIASLFGLYFSKKFINPIDGIIGGIFQLSQGIYHIDIKEEGIYKDVSENIKNLGLVLGRNEEERKRLDTMKEEWISNISHDIKTPLSSIQGYAELLGSDYELSNDEIKEYSKIIENKSMYIEALVEDLHLSTRLKNKDIILNLERTNMVRLVKDIIVDILNNPNHENSNINYIYEEEIIEAYVDIFLFKRVINNILINAIYHNDSNIKIDVIVGKENNNAFIKIEDNGKGIAEEDMKKIFNRYYRGTDTTKEGSGLGLAIANDIVKAHNGKINVESQLGKGTIFTVVLPELKE